MIRNQNFTAIPAATSDEQPLTTVQNANRPLFAKSILKRLK